MIGLLYKDNYSSDSVKYTMFGDQVQFFCLYLNMRKLPRISENTCVD